MGLRLLIAFACCLALPVQAVAREPEADGIARLNELRAANGIPAGIGEHLPWSYACEQHLRYRARNGPGSNPHDEHPELPGYTKAGDEAANSAILGQAKPWPEDGRTPWEDAPLHLAQTLAPALQVTGYRPGCLWTWPGYTRRPLAPALYSYPGNGTTIYPSQRAREWPFTPGEFVGLPQGTVTGPHLFVLGHGVGRSRLTAASLTGPDGPVEVRTVDNHTRTTHGDPGRLLPPGTAIIIPVEPLEAHAAYRASATVTADNGQSLGVSFGFSTTAERDRSRSSRPWLLPAIAGLLVSSLTQVAIRRSRRGEHRA